MENGYRNSALRAIILKHKRHTAPPPLAIGWRTDVRSNLDEHICNFRVDEQKGLHHIG